MHTISNYSLFVGALQLLKRKKLVEQEMERLQARILEMEQYLLPLETVLLNLKNDGKEESESVQLEQLEESRLDWHSLVSTWMNVTATIPEKTSKKSNPTSVDPKWKETLSDEIIIGRLVLGESPKERQLETKRNEYLEQAKLKVKKGDSKGKSCLAGIKACIVIRGLKLLYWTTIQHRCSICNATAETIPR